MIIKAGKNGPKIWGYAKVNGVFTSFWGVDGREKVPDMINNPEAVFALLWKKKATSSGGYREITEDQLRLALPLLPEEFYK